MFTLRVSGLCNDFATFTFGLFLSILSDVGSWLEKKRTEHPTDRLLSVGWSVSFFSLYISLRFI